jgi:hypothetical protein
LSAERRGERREVRDRERADAEALGLRADRVLHEVDTLLRVVDARDRRQYREAFVVLLAVDDRPIEDRVREIERKLRLELERKNVGELALRGLGDAHRAERRERAGELCRDAVRRAFAERGLGGLADRDDDIAVLDGRAREPFEHELAIRAADHCRLHARRADVDA